MGGKHLKKLRAEKSKIKLKKKVLPKGQNITDTAFKVKKIFTIEQLKPVDKNEPVSSWNLPLKDLLIRLNHYNHTSRMNALNGIKELLTNYPEILKGPSLKLLVTRVLDLLTDDESKIRVTAVEVMRYIFEYLPPTSIIPFHEILNVYLNCAMTHRNVFVQQDSLKFIDVIVNFAPGALKHNFQSLAHNFTRIIKANLHGSYSVPSRMEFKQGFEKSRIEMFVSFYYFLSVSYSKPELQKQSNTKILTISNLTSKKKISLIGCHSHYKEIPNLALFRKLENEKKIIFDKFDSNEFKVHCSFIMPLLFDTWVEFSPKQTSSQLASDYTLSGSFGALLYVILQIFLLLHERVVITGDPSLESWFVSTYGSSFQKCFLSNFPYAQSTTCHSSQMSIRPDLANIDSTECIKQNLIICYLSYLFKIAHKDIEVEGKIEAYILNALMANNPTGVDILSKVVEQIISSPKRKNFDVILNGVITAHSLTNSSEFRQRLSEILMKIILENDCFQGNQNLLQWMKTLPHHLQKPRISRQLIETVLELIKRPVGVHVLKETENKAVEIVQNLPSAKIEGVSQFEGQKMIINIIYWCDNVVLEGVIKKLFLDKSMYPEVLRNYIIDIFSYKLKSN